jgi:hypothetical protein
MRSGYPAPRFSQSLFNQFSFRRRNFLREDEFVSRFRVDRPLGSPALIYRKSHRFAHDDRSFDDVPQFAYVSGALTFVNERTADSTSQTIGAAARLGMKRSTLQPACKSSGRRPC